MPSIVILLSALVNLGVAIVLYYTATGPWADVEAQQAIISDWFTMLFDSITSAATDIATDATTFVSGAFATLGDFISFFNDYLDRFIQWFEGGIHYLDNFLNATWPDLYDRFSQIESIVQDWLVNGVSGIIGLTQEVWDWVLGVFSDPFNWLTALLGDIWTQVVAFFANPLDYITALLGDIWTFVVALFSAPYEWLTALLGDIWTQVVSFFSAPLEWITALLGDTWQALLDFLADPASYLAALLPGGLADMFNFLTEFLPGIVSFFGDPVGYILAAIRDYFLPWLEQLIADNW